MDNVFSYACDPAISPRSLATSFSIALKSSMAFASAGTPSMIAALKSACADLKDGGTRMPNHFRGSPGILVEVALDAGVFGS